MSGGNYYLPVSTAEVICINVAQGKIVGRTRSRKGYIPGNLICYKGDVISLGVDSLDDFYQLARLRDRVAAALQKNPEDAESLALRGQMELNAGKVAESVHDIRSAYDQNSRKLAAVNAEIAGGKLTGKNADNALRDAEASITVTRGLLVDAMLAALRSDFKGSRLTVGELEKLISFPSEQAEFLRMLAEGLQKSNDRLSAVDAYLKLADLKWGQDELEAIEPNLSVRRDRWVEARMASLYTNAPPDDRAKIDAELSKRVKATIAGKNDRDLRAYASYFAFHPTADEARAPRWCGSLAATNRCSSGKCC